MYYNKVEIHIMKEGKNMTCKRCPDKSVLCLMSAAMRGDPESQFKLGLLYTDRKFIEHSFINAGKWLLKAAEQGHREAQNALISLYIQNEVIPELFNRAAEYMSQMEKENYCQRQNDVVDLNEVDRRQLSEKIFKQGVNSYNEQQFNESVKYFERAAELGLRKAQIQLAKMYGEGDGIQKDVIKAQYWREMAKSLNGNNNF